MDNFLSVKNVTKNFRGLTALSKVNLVVEEGTVHGLIGPNGSGKTTFFNVLSGVLRPTDGEIYLKGKNLVGLKPNMVSNNGIARTFQNIKLFKELSVIDNVKVGIGSRYSISYLDVMLRTPKAKRYEREIQEKAEHLLETIGLAADKDRIAANLPYGRQRVLEIARAWGTKPHLLLLDEPCAGMNNKEKDDLVELIYLLKNAKITVILVEHDMKMVMKVTNRLTVFDSGIKIAEGTPIEISNNPKVIEAYLGKERHRAAT